MIILVVASLAAIFWQPAKIVGTAIILLAILSNLTVLQRSVHVYNKSKKMEINRS
jgi:hypothetical protein